MWKRPWVWNSSDDEKWADKNAYRCSERNEYRATAGAILVDVREADEFASGDIPGAVNAPLSTISHTALPRTAPMFIYCLRGSRSKRGAGILKRMGYTVKSSGGISGYKETIERRLDYAMPANRHWSGRQNDVK